MTNTSKNFENILKYREQESNLLWVSREIHPQYAYLQEKEPTPTSHKRDVLNSLKIQELLNKISQTQNIPIRDLEKKVVLILDEIGYNRKWKLIRWLALVLTKICVTVSTGIYVTKDNIREVKSAMGSCPVIFVPSHRSYVDFILMSYVCFAYDVAIPVIAAGMDFQGMVGMGTVLRNSGAFFMRRSYNDDDLYWSTFRQYIYQLVTKGDLPLEFFIEGTRSRSNKSLLPKYGLLSMILKAYFFAQVPDILFVPINVSYDRLFEENLFAYELLGVPKPKESTSGFFKSLKILKESFGNIYIHFDTPISVREFFKDKVDRSSHGMSPLHSQELTKEEKSLMPALAHEIVYRQQKCSTLTVFNLLAVVINHHLVTGKSALPFSELVAEVSWLKDVLELCGAHVHSPTDLENSVKECFVVHSNLVELTSEQTVRLVTSRVTQDKVDPKRLKAHSLTDQTMTYCVPFVMLQIYINATFHYLVDSALLVAVLKKCDSLSEDDLYREYNFFRSLYLVEFVVYPGHIKKQFEQSLHLSLSLNLLKNENGYGLGNNEKLQNLLSSSIEPFLNSYLVTISVLQNLPTPSDEKTILVNVQEILEKAINETEEFIHPYCLNLDTLMNCLNNLSTVGILEKSRRENKIWYKIDKGKLEEMRRKLDACIPKTHLQEYLFKINHRHNKL